MLEGGLGIVARKGHLRAKVRDVVAESDADSPLTSNAASEDPAATSRSIRCDHSRLKDGALPHTR